MSDYWMNLHAFLSLVEPAVISRFGCLFVLYCVYLGTQRYRITCVDLLLSYVLI